MEDQFVFSYPQSKVLKRLVSNFFYIKTKEISYFEEQKVLPYSFFTLGFFLKGSFLVSKEDSNLVIKYTLSKMSKSSTLVKSVHDEIEIIGVNFYPFSLTAFSNANIDLLNWNSNPNNVFEEEIEPIYQELIKKNSSLEAKNKLIEDYLLRNIRFFPDIISMQAIQIIANNTAEKNLKVKEIAEQLAISDRTLRTHFKKCMGCTPKEYLKIVRIEKTIKDIKEMGDNEKDMMDIAFKNDYFDQSHFIKDFKEITGVSPKKLEKIMKNFRFLQF